jgi:hypothetical protein
MAKGKNPQNKKKSAGAKKTSRPKNPLAKHDPKKDKPIRVQPKGNTVSGASLLTDTLLRMEDDLRISKKQGRDFVDSLEVAITEAISAGKPVNLFGLVKITPVLVTGGVAQVNKEFGNPESGKIKKTYKAKVVFKAGQGVFMKPLKEALPSVQKLHKTITG